MTSPFATAYTKKNIKEAHVERFEYNCGVCKSNNVTYCSTPHSDTGGARCGQCNTFVWFNSRNSKILMNEYRDELGDYKAWFARTTAEFLKKLPSCPQCDADGFSEYRAAVPRSPLSCYACGALHDNGWKLVTSKHEDQEIWWLNEPP